MSSLIRLICILPHGMAPVWFDLHNFMHEIMLLNFNTFPVNSLAYFDVVGLGVSCRFVSFSFAYFCTTFFKFFFFFLFFLQDVKSVGKKSRRYRSRSLSASSTDSHSSGTNQLLIELNWLTWLNSWLEFSIGVV